MDGPIELPAEANPLTERQLFHVLVSASSSQQLQIQTGAKQLQAWEREDGFYPLLQSMFLDKSLPTEVRHLAIIQLRNGVEKYWRKASMYHASDADKAAVRSRLLQSAVEEADQTLLLQAALVIGKVTRIEYPNEWPTVITDILEILRKSAQEEAFSIHLPRALKVVLFIIKELLTARLQRQRGNLQSIAPELFQVLAEIYVSKAQKWQSFLENGGHDEGGALDDLEHSLLSLRVIRRLAVNGFKRPQDDGNVQQLWAFLKPQLDGIVSLLHNQQLPPLVRDLVERVAIQIGKLHIHMIRLHPTSFLQLPLSIHLVQAYWALVCQFGSVDQSDGDEQSFDEKLCLYGMRILSTTIAIAYSPRHTFRSTSGEAKLENEESSRIMKEEVLTDERVKQLLEVLVRHFLRLQPRDLRNWADSGEEWQQDQEGAGDAFEYSLRPSAERLFIFLTLHFEALVIPPLLAVFQQIANVANEDIIFKDSVYNAVGLAANKICDHFDFDEFVKSVLAVEVKLPHPSYNIIRRRAAILTSQCNSVNSSEKSRPLIYQIFDFLLSPDDPLNDLVVRITAGKYLKTVVLDWEFEKDSFLPVAPSTLERLLQLIQLVELPETRQELLQTVTAIVEQLLDKVTPFSEGIVNLLPALWDQSGKENLTKQAILTLLTSLCNAMRAESYVLQPLCIPIIREAIDPQSDSHVYLFDEALELWCAIVQQTEISRRNPKPDIIQLAPSILPLFELGSEALRKALEITDAYILLSPWTLLSGETGLPLMNAFNALLSGKLSREASALVVDTMNNMLQATTTEGDHSFQALVEDMAKSGILTKLLQELYYVWASNEGGGGTIPKDVQPLDEVVEADYFSILARIAMHSPFLLVQAVEASAPPGPFLKNTPIMNWLLLDWFLLLDKIGDLGRRKLMILALTKLIETKEKWILDELQHYLSSWTYMVGELFDDSECRNDDVLVWTALSSSRKIESPQQEKIRIMEQNDPLDASVEHRSLHLRRAWLLEYHDPVHRIHIRPFIKHHLPLLVEACGGEEQFRRHLADIDKTVVDQFAALRIDE